MNENERKTLKKVSSSEVLSVEFENLKINQKEKTEANNPDIKNESLIEKNNFLSSDTLSLMNTSDRKSFMMSDLDISNYSFLQQNAPRKKIKQVRSLSNSFQNLMKNIVDEEEENKKCPEKIDPKAGIIRKSKTGLNKSEYYSNIRELLKSDDKIFLNLSVHSNVNNAYDNNSVSNSISKRKENFIPKTEICGNAITNLVAKEQVNKNPGNPLVN
jgi:hypothetical protein